MENLAGNNAVISRAFAHSLTHSLSQYGLKYTLIIMVQLHSIILKTVICKYPSVINVLNDSGKIWNINQES